MMSEKDTELLHHLVHFDYEGQLIRKKARSVNGQSVNGGRIQTFRYLLL